MSMDSCDWFARRGEHQQGKRDGERAAKSTHGVRTKASSDAGGPFNVSQRRELGCHEANRPGNDNLGDRRKALRP
jgi:hypothetical protein